MSLTNNQLNEFIKNEVKKYEGVYVPVKANILERAIIRSVSPKRLHPNPDDEFSFPTVGPHFGIIAKYEAQFRSRGKIKDDPWDESIQVQKIYPDGYMILNGHHRWAAALRTDIKRIPVNIINITHEVDIENMLRLSDHDKRVSLDLDEVIFCDPEKTEAEKPLKFPFNKIYKERIRKGIPSLLHILSRNGYDIWVYSSKYYSYDYISNYFKKYSVRLNGIITGTARKVKGKEEASKRIEKMFKEKYSETLHIDDKVVLRTIKGQKDFDDIPIVDEGDGWAYAVINIIKKLYPEE